MVEPDMDVRILIPDANSYGLALLVLYSLSSIALASQLFRRLFAARGMRVLDVYSAVMFLPCLWGMVLFSPEALLGARGLACALGVPVGLAAGAAATWSDRRLIRALNRNSVAQRKPSKDRSVVGMSGIESQTLHWQSTASTIDRAPRRILGVNRSQWRYNPVLVQREFGLRTVITVAVVEELVYRGVMVQACFLLPGRGWAAVALVGLVAAFALAHIWFGWEQVLAKLPLSAVAMASVLALGTVVPAVIAHVFFNLKIRHDMLIRRDVAAAA
jgi:Type II CAAX prenyl endopeptidase Rce1-like